MTDLMPRDLPRYVHCERSRHGGAVYYFRKGKGPRTRLPPLGSPTFDEAYLQALAGVIAPRKVSGAAGSLEWLIRRYRETAAYTGLSYATRRQRDNIFKGVVAKAGHHPYRKITRKAIVNGKDDRAATPAQARNYLDAMRGLFRWAFEAELIADDPTASVKNPPRPKGEGFAQWSEDDVLAFETRWPAGTREYVWLHVLLYTGLRRGDAVVLGRQHVKDGFATLKTEKTGTEVTIPILPLLQRTLDLGPTGDLAFIVGKNGRPLKKESFGNCFKTACKAAGLPKRSAHGLRKLGATRAAEAGATVNELEALFGWSGGAMASHYTKKADRRRLARQAAEKMRNAQAPHLEMRSPAPEKKAL